MEISIHLLKLVTGVEISARPVRRSGSRGKAEKRKKRRAAAEPKSSTFRRSMAMMPVSVLQAPAQRYPLARTDAKVREVICW